MIRCHVFHSVAKHYNPYSGNFASLLTCPTTDNNPYSADLASVHHRSHVPSQEHTCSGQSTHFKGWGFEILKNCKRVGVHIFPLKRVHSYKGWKQTIKGGVLQTSKLCTYIYKTKLKK